MLFNVSFKTTKMSKEWRLSTMVQLYKNKGDIQNCNNYIGITKSHYENLGEGDEDEGEERCVHF